MLEVARAERQGAADLKRKSAGSIPAAAAAAAAAIGLELLVAGGVPSLASRLENVLLLRHVRRRRCIGASANRSERRKRQNGRRRQYTHAHHSLPPPSCPQYGMARSRPWASSGRQPI